MLKLTRRISESVVIGDINPAKVTVLSIGHYQVKLGIQTARGVNVYRDEIYLRILAERKKSQEQTGQASTMIPDANCLIEDLLLRINEMETLTAINIDSFASEPESILNYSQRMKCLTSELRELTLALRQKFSDSIIHSL
jgi:carbon storage regulator